MNSIIISQDLFHYLQSKPITLGQFSQNTLIKSKTWGQFSLNSHQKAHNRLFIHSQFQNTVNYIDNRGEIFSIINHKNFVPMSIYIDKDMMGEIRIENLKDIVGGRLYFTRGVEIDLARATIWNPFYFLSGECISQNSMEYLQQLIISTTDKTNIILPLKKVLFGIEYSINLEQLTVQDRIFISKFEDILHQLFSSTYDSNTQKLFEKLDSFIGLGGGLTPSGDDFISGFIWGLRLRGKQDLAQNLIEDIFLKAKSETNDISLQFLNFTQENKLSIHQKYFIYSLSIGRYHNIDIAFAKLKQWGHSSGIDWICGLYGGWILNI